jgi:hypothetical protein
MSRESSDELTSLLIWVESCLADAALSLTYFQQALATLHSPERWKEDRHEEWEARRRIEAMLLSQMTPGERWAAMEAARHAAELEVRRTQWARGRLPDSYVHRLPFLHARSFVTALEGVRKGLGVMKSLPGAPPKVGHIVARLDADLEVMKHLRDSIQHGEDRIRGKYYGKDINFRPVENSAVNAPHGGALVYDLLNGTRYGCHLGDGSFGEVDVTAQTALRVRDAVQEVVNTFAWTGPRQDRPR